MFVKLQTPKSIVTVREGDRQAELKVDIIAKPGLNITWYKDGALITDEYENIWQNLL